MFQNDTFQDSSSPIESNGDVICLSSPLSNTTQCESIQVRSCRREGVTIAAGRRPKHLVLHGIEAIRREKRRERNRRSARRLKEKRLLFEQGLNQKLRELEDQHSDLENYLQNLLQRKQFLEDKMNNTFSDPIDELFSIDNHNMPLFFEQYSDDLDLFDESILSILNCDSDISFYPPFLL